MYLIFSPLVVSLLHLCLLSRLSAEWNATDGSLFQVDPDNIRPIQEGTVNAMLEAERVAEATKQAIKRKIAQAASVDFQSRTLPAKLRIEPDDPEDVVSYNS